MRILLWFRADLRTDDNPALFHACRDATRGVIGVFAICPDQWAEHDWGSMRVDFVRRNLFELRAKLGTLNIPLRLIETPRFDGMPDAMLALARELDADALYLNRELEINEARRDDDVADAFESDARTIRAFDDATILEPGAVRTNAGDWYTVYSPFRRRFAEIYNERGGVERLGTPSPQPDRPCSGDTLPGRIPGFDGHARPDLWPAGEDHAIDRLNAFIERRIDRYKAERDYPALDATSTLSPYLASGVISPRRCLHAAIDAAGGTLPVKPRNPGGPDAWANELIWREFYKHLIAGYPRLCMGTNFRREYDALPWRDDDDAFDAWSAGRTGYPIIDAAMGQLNRTGWMHNRLRMIVAMFLTKNLLIDWRRGERYFMQHLVDGDLASNNGGWQWSASTGTDAAPYFRIFNPVTQSQRFDPDGEFIRRFLPELAGVEENAIHEPWTLPELLRSTLDYPEPIVDHKATRERAIEAFRTLKDAG